MSFVEVVRDGPVTRVTLNRPEALNAITVDMHFALQAAFDDFAHDPEQLVCLVTGAGDRAFCAGSDLKGAVGSESPIPEYPRSGYAGLVERFDCDKPFIAVVNGLAMGGGFEVALACDIIVASERASFGLPEPLVGAIALAGGLHRLPRRIPQNLAMEMILTSRRVDAAKALRWGIVNDVVPHDALMATANDLCSAILKASPRAIATSKAIVRRSLAEADVETGLRQQSGYPEFSMWRTSQDFVEGVQAFADKRPPRWSGR